MSSCEEEYHIIPDLILHVYGRIKCSELQTLKSSRHHKKMDDNHVQQLQSPLPRAVALDL